LFHYRNPGPFNGFNFPENPNAMLIMGKFMIESSANDYAAEK
jgi:hypothetical protein